MAVLAHLLAAMTVALFGTALHHTLVLVDRVRSEGAEMVAGELGVWALLWAKVLVGLTFAAFLALNAN